MSYPISEQLIKYNRSGKRLSPKGYVIHATDTPGASAQNEHDYFNSGDRGASAHYFVDWGEIVRCIPESEQAWHAGPTANNRFLSVEMCEPKGTDRIKFEQVWLRTVWLVADACARYGWNTRDNVFSHRGIAAMYGETDHTDPIGYLAQYGHTWEQLLAAIEVEIKKLKGDDLMEHAILYFGADDFVAARRIAEQYGNCAMFARGPNASFNPDVLKAKHLVVVGGPKSPDISAHPNLTYLSGQTWFDTVMEVKKFLGY